MPTRCAADSHNLKEQKVAPQSSIQTSPASSYASFSPFSCPMIKFISKKPPITSNGTNANVSNVNSHPNVNETPRATPAISQSAKLASGWVDYELSRSTYFFQKMKRHKFNQTRKNNFLYRQRHGRNREMKLASHLPSF